MISLVEMISTEERVCCSCGCVIKEGEKIIRKKAMKEKTRNTKRKNLIEKRLCLWYCPSCANRLLYVDGLEGND